MDKVTNELVPFMVSWQSKQPFHTPNSIQDSACMNVVAKRLIEECFYEYATKTNPNTISADADKQAKQIVFIAKSLADAALGVVAKEGNLK